MLFTENIKNSINIINFHDIIILIIIIYLFILILFRFFPNLCKIFYLKSVEKFSLKINKKNKKRKKKKLGILKK